MIDVLTVGGNVILVPSIDHGPPSNVQGAPSASLITSIIQASHSQSKPTTNENIAPLSTCSPTSTNNIQALLKTDRTKSTPGLDVVWAEALKIAEKKLSDNNLPLDLTNLTSQSSGENIKAVIEALDALQKDENKKRWAYTWRGKEVIVVEHLGKILKAVQPYSKVVDAAIQVDLRVTALVWAGVLALMRVGIHILSQLKKTMLILWQVTLDHVDHLIEGLEAAIAVLLEKVTICEFYAGIYVGVPVDSNLQLESLLDTSLPDLYAAVVVFVVKACSYFEGNGTLCLSYMLWNMLSHHQQ